MDPFTGQQISQPGPLPYADIRNPQSLNKYGYVLNNPLRYIDPDGHSEHEGLFGLVQDWADVFELKASVGLSVGVSGQAGPAEYKLEATAFGVEGKTGLGGGNADLKLLSEAVIHGKVGPLSANFKAGGEVSATNGPSAEVSAGVKAGGVGAGAGVKVDSNGVSSNTKTSANTGADTKIGVGAKVVVAGVSVGLNVSQAQRASTRTAESARAFWSYLTKAVREKLNLGEQQ